MSDTDHNKWVMFKNYMHNELGITKEEIKKWTQEAVEKVATDYTNKLIASSSLNKLVNKAVADLMENRFGSYTGRSQLQNKIAEELAKQLIVSMKPEHQIVADKIVAKSNP